MRAAILALFLAGCSKNDDTTAVEADCADGTDDDGDGTTDCADADCATFHSCIAEICNDAVDNDQNGQLDCEDDACEGSVHCLPAIVGYSGDAQVTGGHWAGDETKIAVAKDDATNVLCHYHWDTVGDTDLTTAHITVPCKDLDGVACTFAFAVSGTDGAAVSGCPDDAGGSNWGPYGYGFAETWNGDGYTDTNVVVNYFPEYSGWFAIDGSEASQTGSSYHYEFSFDGYY
jgi:hypothetical protein